VFALLSLVLLVLVVPAAARADNPIVQTIYTADPAPLVHDGRVYLYTGHDEDGSTYFTMKEWRVWSSADMVNWTDHGSPLNLASFSWASNNAWAGQTVERNGKFYWYVPMTVRATGQMGIGMAASTSPTGPFTDAIGHPLVSNGQIDPTVFIDDDGQAYLYWGNPDLWYVKLNPDMTSYAGSPAKIALTTAGFGTRTGDPNRPTLFEEGPWVYKRSGLYYLVYAAKCCSEFIAYSTAPGPLGPWTYRGTVMPTQGGSFTNHPGIIDFAGNSYFFYHNGALPRGGGYTRSVAVEKFSYGSGGTIPTIPRGSPRLPAAAGSRLRAAKRMVNIYQMLRTTTFLGSASDFLGSGNRPGEHQAVVQLVGILTAFPELFGQMCWGSADQPAGDPSGTVRPLMRMDPASSWPTFVNGLDPTRQPPDAWRNNVVERIDDDAVESWRKLVATWPGA
jgi:Glycosyl hydrolases family 43